MNVFTMLLISPLPSQILTPYFVHSAFVAHDPPPYHLRCPHRTPSASRCTQYIRNLQRSYTANRLLSRCLNTTRIIVPLTLFLNELSLNHCFQITLSKNNSTSNQGAP